MSKKRIEALFKANFQVDNVTDQAVKKYLEDAIPGLKIKNIEIYPGKSHNKAVIASNIIDLLMGTDLNAEPEFYGRGQSVSFIERPQLDIKTNEDMKEINELGIKLSEAKKEIAKLKEENNKLAKQGSPTKNNEEDVKMLQSQIQGLTSQLEVFDMERCELEEKNNGLEKEIASLKKTIELRTELKEFINDEGDGEFTRMTSYEKLFSQKQQEFEEEKAILQEKLSSMSVKFLDEQEKNADIKKKVVLADTLIDENKNLKEQNVKQEEEIQEKNKMIEDLNNKIQSLEETINKNEENIKKNKKDLTKALNVCKKLGDQKKENEELKVKITSLEDKYIKKNSELNSDLEKKKQEVEQQKTEINSLNEEKQRIMKESETNQEKYNDTLNIKNLEITKLEEEKKMQLITINELELKVKKAEELNNEAILQDYSKKTEELKKEYEKKIEITEFEKVRREKDLKASDEKREKIDRELIILKAKYNSLEKTMTAKSDELTALKESTGINVESSQKQAEELENIKREFAELKELNGKLKIEADDRNSAVEAFLSLQKQHELMVKENSELKATLFVYENSQKSIVEETKQDTSKLKIIDEIRQILAEVIYSYKTMSTDAKQNIMNIEVKKYKLDDFLSTKNKVLSFKKKEEILPALKTLESSEVFLKGIPNKAENIKLIINCLKEIGIKKAAKVGMYNEEIEKYKGIISISDSKITEYEERLALYY